MRIFKQGKYFLSSLKHLPGWKTNRKIVVFESDDWGSIRMPSRRIYENCLNNGYRVDENIFDKYYILVNEYKLEILNTL